MAKISVNDIRPGMRLATDLISDMGRFLLGKGTVLEEAHVRILKIWGIMALDVEQGSEETEAEAEAISPEALARAEDVLRHRFRQNDLEFPVTRQLHRICVERLARRIGRGLKLQNPAPDAADEEQVDLQVLGDRHHTRPEDVLGSGDMSLAAMPSILGELVDVINNPRSSALEIARVVEKDTSLAAKLLRIVNSPFYGFPARIDTISRAVTIIGSRQLTTLAVGVVAISHFKGIPSDLIDMRAFWIHSLMAGYAARLLASTTNTPNSERFFVAGLLHDIGRLIFYKLRPEGSAECLGAAKLLHEANHRMERKIFGFDHGVMGGVVFKSWNFPVVLENAVRYHHNPMRSPSFREAAMVHFADILAWAMDDSHLDLVIPPLNPTVWESLGLPAVSLPAMVEQLDFLFSQTAQHFLDEV